MGQFRVGGNKLVTDLTSVEYGFTVADQVLLEKKSDMKRRGLASPDDGDALALTFAQPAAIDMPEETPRAGQVQREYNPYEAANIGHDPYATVR